MKNKDLPFLQSELSRVSEWVQFADKKAGFIAIFYSAIFGFLWGQRNEIYTHSLNTGISTTIYIIIIVSIFVLLVVGLFFLFATVCPRVKNGNTDRSLFYFGTIAKMKIADYLNDIEKLSEEDAVKQVAEQIHTNSVIANTKMTNVTKSTYVLVAVGVLLIIFLII